MFDEVALTHAQNQATKCPADCKQQPNFERASRAQEPYAWLSTALSDLTAPDKSTKSKIVIFDSKFKDHFVQMFLFWSFLEANVMFFACSKILGMKWRYKPHYLQISIIILK